MAQKYSGRNIGLFIGKQTAFATGVAPTTCLKQNGFSGGLTPEYVQSAARMGSRALSGNYPSSKSGKLSVPFEADPENLGFFLKGLLGTETVTRIGLTDAYKHTFTMFNDSALPAWSLTRQYAWKTLRAIGAILNSLSLELSPKAIVTGSAEYIYKDDEDIAISFLPAAVTIATDLIELSTGHGLVVDDAVRFCSPVASVLPAPLQANTTYYVKTVSGNDISLSLTKAGDVIDLTSTGTGTNTIQKWETLEPTTERPYIYNDGKFKIDDLDFGEARSASLSFGNNLSTDDFRLNGGGSLASIPAGKFDASGKLSVIFNEIGEVLRVKYQQGTPCKLQISLDTGVKIASSNETSRVEFIYEKVQFKTGDIGTDEDGMMMDMDFDAFASPLSPITVNIYNTRATAY